MEKLVIDIIQDKMAENSDINEERRLSSFNATSMQDQS